MLANSRGRGMIIFPIAQKIFHSVLLQQRPRWTRGLTIPVGSTRHHGTRPSLPWDDSDRPPSINFGRNDKNPDTSKVLDANFGLCALGVQPINPSVIKKPHFGLLGTQPSVVHPQKPMPAKYWVVSGVTKDSTGAVLGSCVVQLFRTIDDGIMDEITSNASTGAFEFRSASNPSNTHYVVAYKAGAPDVAGTTVNTITPL